MRPCTTHHLHLASTSTKLSGLHNSGLILNEFFYTHLTRASTLLITSVTLPPGASPHPTTAPICLTCLEVEWFSHRY